MNIEFFIGKPIKEVQQQLRGQNFIVNDVNGDSFFDKGDILQYRVKKGDNLSKIAKKIEGRNLQNLIDFNKQIKNPDNLKIGEIINIPLVLEQQTEEEQANNTQVKPQVTPQVTPQTTPKKNLFGDIKTKKVTDPKIQKDFWNKKIADLKEEGYYVEDKNNNGIFDGDDTLHKQVTVMIDAGHGSGVHLEKKQKVKIPNKKEPYITKKNDTYESIAEDNKIDVEVLKKLNPNLRFSRDPGAVPPSTIGTNDEAYINGVASEELHKILEQEGFRVVDNVRTDGNNRPDRQRNKMNEAPDMFISLHCNSSEDSSASGEEVVYNTASPEDKKFAQTVNEALDADNTIEKNRGIKPDTRGICVLKGDTNGNIAEILVEMGFISNQSDYNKLNDNDKLKKQLEAIAKGVSTYYENEINVDA